MTAAELLAKLRSGDLQGVMSALSSLPNTLRRSDEMRRIEALVQLQRSGPHAALAFLRTPPLGPTTSAATLALASQLALDCNEFDFALVTLQALVRSNPQVLRYWEMFARAAEHTQKLGVIETELTSSGIDPAASLLLSETIDRYLLKQRRHAEALQLCQRTHQQFPASSSAIRRCIRRAVELTPLSADPVQTPSPSRLGLSLDGALLDAALAIPEIFASTTVRSAWRARLFQEMQWILACAQAQRCDVSILTRMPFFLAYHGEDDLPFQRLWATIVTTLVGNTALKTSFNASATRQRSAGELRIGFVTAHLRECTIYNYFASWIGTALSSATRVALYSAGREDGVTASVGERVHIHHRYENQISSYVTIAKQIVDDDNDVLIYPEIGMEPLIAALAATRLASRQYAAWGHPVSTALSTVDGYLSFAAAEPADSQAAYAEPLHLLPGMGTCFPVIDQVRPQPDRSGSKLRLICAQSIFKWSPAFVEAVGEILHRLPNAQLHYFHAERATPNEAFVGMLEKIWQPLGINPVVRTVCHGERPREQFLQVLGSMDLALDSFGFSGGQTTVDSVSVGLPVVTLPGAFMRGRQTLGMLQLMNIDELIVESVPQYVERVIELCLAPERLMEIKQKLFERKHVALHDTAPLAALREFLETHRAATKTSDVHD